MVHRPARAPTVPTAQPLVNTMPPPSRTATAAPWSLTASPRLVGLTLALVLAGCSTPDSLTVRAPDLPASYGGGALAPRRDLAGWWRTFHDPVLETLVERARRQNLNIAQGRARLKAARKLADASASLFLPGAGVAGQAMAGTSHEPIDDPLRRPIMAGMDMSWDVGLFGLSENTRRAADAQVGVAEADVEAAQIAVTAEVAAAYISLRAAQRQLDLSNAQVGAQAWRAQLAGARVRHGLAVRGDDSDGAAARNDARADMARWQGRAAVHRQQIATLLGAATPDAALSTTADQPLAREAPPASQPADLLRARPDVRAAEQRVLKAAAEIGIAEADLYPRLRLNGAVGVGGPTATTPFGLAGGPSLQMPLFDYGRRQAVLHARRALLEEALAGYQQTVLTAYEEASNALAQWRAASIAAAAEAETVAAQQRAHQRTRTLLRDGIAESLRLAEADAALLSAQRRLVSAREAEALALVAVYKALGAAAAADIGARD